MKILCRIKKALNIKSPVPYKYCYLDLNSENKKRCRKCEHFKASMYYAQEFADSLMSGIEEAVKEVAERMKKGNAR